MQASANDHVTDARFSAWRVVVTLLLVTVIVLIAVGLYEAYRPRRQEAMSANDALYYTTHRYGARDATQTHYVLLISSAYTNGDVWRLLLRHHWPSSTPTCDTALHFIVPDLLGTGRSPWPSLARQPDAYTVESHAAALLRVLRSAVPAGAPLHIAGICFGGVLALHLAAQVKPASLTLLSTPYFESGEAAWSTGEQHAIWYRQPWLINLYIRAVARQRWLCGSLLRRGVALKCPKLGAVSDAYCDASPEALRQSLLDVSCRYRPQRAALRVGSLHVPTLCVRGERSLLCNDARNARLLADTGARGLVVRGRGASHNVFLRQPQLVMSAMHEFITSIIIGR